MSECKSSKPEISGKREAGHPDVVEIPVSEVYELTELKILRKLEDKFVEQVQRKAKKWGFLLGVITLVGAIFGISSFWSQIRAFVESTVSSEVDQKLGNQLPRLQARIDETWVSGVRAKDASDKSVQALEAHTSMQQKMGSDLKELQLVADAAKTEVALLQSKITEQSNSLSRLETILSSFFSNSKSETISFSDTNAAPIIPLPNGKFLAVFRLSSIPLQGSLRLQYHVYSQPPGSFWTQRNITFFVWGEYPENLKAKPLYALYVSNPTETNIVQKLELKQGIVFADGAPLLDVRTVPLK